MVMVETGKQVAMICTLTSILIFTTCWLYNWEWWGKNCTVEKYFSEIVQGE